MKMDDCSRGGEEEEEEGAEKEAEEAAAETQGPGRATAWRKQGNLALHSGDTMKKNKVVFTAAGEKTLHPSRIFFSFQIIVWLLQGCTPLGSGPARLPKQKKSHNVAAVK